MIEQSEQVQNSSTVFLFWSEEEKINRRKKRGYILFGIHLEEEDGKGNISSLVEKQRRKIFVLGEEILRCRGGKERRRKRVNMFRECKLEQVREILKCGVCIP